MLLALASPALAFRPDAVDFVDSATGRVRCHLEQESDRARCEEVVVWAEEAWAAQVDGLGFRAPLPDDGRGGSDALDIYLTREAGGSGSAWVDCEGGDPNCVDDDPADGVAAAASYVVIDPRTPEGDFPHFVHHEFQHTTQYATDYAEPFLSLWEATAVAAERWTDPTWETSAADLGDYQAFPWMSAVLQDGYFLLDEQGIESWYEYGAVAWIWFLDERYADGAGGIGPALWAAVAQEAGDPNEPDVLDAWDVVSGDWVLSMLEFAAARARMGTDGGPAYVAFAGAEAWAPREGTLTAPGEVEPTIAPYPLGTSYWEVEVPAGEVLVARVDGDPDVRWGIVVVEPGGETIVEGTEAEHLVLGSVVTVGVVNLGPQGFDADDPLEPAAFTLSIAWGPAAGGDPEGPEGDPAEGCGCATTGAPTGALLLAVALAARRRPRRLQ